MKKPKDWMARTVLKIHKEMDDWAFYTRYYVIEELTRGSDIEGNIYFKKAQELQEKLKEFILKYRKEYQKQSDREDVKYARKILKRKTK